MNPRLSNLPSAIDKQDASHPHAKGLDIVGKKDGFNKRLTAMAMGGMALGGVSLGAMAETTPPNVPTAPSVAATNPEQDVNANTLQRHLEFGKGAGVDVAMGKTSILVRGTPSAEVMAEANGLPVELIIAAATPVDGEKQPLLWKYMDKWQPLGEESDYYAFDDIPLSVSLGDLSAYKGIIYYIGYGIGKTADERLQYTLSHGAFDNVPMTPPTTVAFFEATDLAIPGAKVASTPLDISKIATSAKPATITGTGGAEVMAVPTDGQTGEWKKSIVANGTQQIQLRGKTASAWGVPTLISAAINDGAEQIAWKVTNKKAPNTTQAPETTKTPEIKEVTAESLSPNEAAPTPFNGAIKITIPNGATEVYIQKIFYTGPRDTGTEYTSGTSIQPDPLVKEYSVFYMDNGAFKDFYFTLNNKVDK